MSSGCILGKALRIARAQPLLFFSVVLVGLVSCQGKVDQLNALSQIKFVVDVGNWPIDAPRINAHLQRFANLTESGLFGFAKSHEQVRNLFLLSHSKSPDFELNSGDGH